MADMNKRGPDCNDCGDGEGGERGERGEKGERGKRGSRGHDGKDGHDGRDGRDGNDGPTGPTGPGGNGGVGSTGPTGPCCTGPTGSAGATGMTGQSGVSASIIPFASGAPVVLSDLLNEIRTGAVIGFGNSGPTPDLLGGTLDLEGGPGVVLDMAWSMPDDGTLVQLSAMYSNVAATDLGLDGEATVFVQLYSAPPGSNIFSPIGPALELGPPFTGLLTLGDTRNGTISLGDIGVTNEDRLVLVAYVVVEGVVATAPTILSGYISAGLKIVVD